MSIDIWLGVIVICLIYLFFIKEVNLQSSIKHAKTFYEKLQKSLTFTGCDIYGDVEYGKISIFTIIITIVIFLVGFVLLTGHYSLGLTKTGLVAMFLSSGILIFHIIYEISKKTFRIDDDCIKMLLGVGVFCVVAFILSFLGGIYRHEIYNCFY